MQKVLIWLAVFLPWLSFAGEVILADNGKACAGIVIPQDAKPVVSFAAAQLKEHLDKMTGASFQISEKALMPVNFFLGCGEAADFVQDEFVIRVNGERIDIFGKDSSKKLDFFNFYYDNPEKGTLTGVFCFLDMLGVRWLAPGKGNEYIPVRKTLKIPEKDIRFKPVFNDRKITGGWNFMQIYPDAEEYIANVNEFYLWGMRNFVTPRGFVDGCHTERALRFYENEERLAQPSQFQTMKDGSQKKEFSCWTDPGTAALWIKAADTYFSGRHPHSAGFMVPSYLDSLWPSPFRNPDEFMIDPMDHYTGNDGRCYCSRCEEFRQKYPCVDDSEIIWKVIAEVARFVETKYPGKYITTLVYPPKTQMPKHTAIPKNIRVRICLSGAREMIFPNRKKEELDKLKTWADFIGEKVPLWTYQCMLHGRVLPGIPDIYPRMIAEYLKLIQPWSAGMLLEQHFLTHTYVNLDTYIFLRMAWDPSRDVEKELHDYFRMYYGPGAAEAEEFFTRLEKNWIRVDKLITKDVPKASTLGLGDISKEEKQKLAWGKVYTLDEMKALDTILKNLEAKTAQNAPYDKRAGHVRKYIYEIMRAERSEVMDKDDIRATLKLTAAKTLEKAPGYELISAVRMKKEIEAGGSFRITSDGEVLTVHADMSEPDMAQSMTDPAHQSGNRDIWKDNCVELFFYAPSSKKFWQIIVNDQGAWTSASKGHRLLKWVQMPGVRVHIERQSSSWQAVIQVPISELKIDQGELRFNFCRERNVKGKKTEYSTWSPLGMVGNWHDPDNYATLVIDQ